MMNEPNDEVDVLSWTPPRNARQAHPTTTAQRAARRAARAASQATSDNGSHAGDGVEENQVNGPAQGQGQAALDAAAVEELRRYREAYGVEKAIEQEAGIEEERKQNQATKAAKRPRETSTPSDNGTVRTPCTECGKMHYGECKGSGCFKCRQLGHIKRNCPQLNDGTVTKTPNITCQLCGCYGHAARDYRDRTEAGTGAALPAPPPKKPATLPRVFVAGNNQGAETIAGK
ncbi:hypothetical protein YC2023_121823 [Brassica napus]